MSKKKLITNSMTGILQSILTAFLAFASVPIFIGKLGIELYGVFALVSIVGNLNTLANFGLNSALLVSVAKQGKCKESNYDIAVTFILLIVIISILSILAIFFSEFIIKVLFAVPEKYESSAKQLIIYLVLANSLLLIGQIFSSIIDSQQKIFLTNISQFTYSLIYWASIISIVLLGGGLNQIGMGMLFASIVWFILVFLFAKKVWGNFQLDGLHQNFFMVLKKQLSYGSKIYFSGMTAFLFEPLSKLLLSHFIGIKATAVFDIGIRVKSQINGLISKGLYPMLPFIASSNITDVFRNKIFDLSKKIQLFVMPISITLIFTLPILIKLWLGDNNLAETTIGIIAITVSMLILSPSVVPIYHFLLAKNHAEKTIYIQLSSVITNLIVFLFLYKSIGFYAILFSNSFAFFSSFVMCNYYQLKFLQIKLAEILQYELKMFFMFLVSSLICYFVFISKSIGLIDLLIYPIIIYSSFLVFIHKFNVFTKEDEVYYFNSLGKLGLIIKKVLLLKN